MAYDKELPGCFGDQDLRFAGHPSDQERACEWLTRLRSRHIGLREALAQVKEFLTEKGAGMSHINEQMARVEGHLRPWLQN